MKCMHTYTIHMNIYMHTSKMNIVEIHVLRAFTVSCFRSYLEWRQGKLIYVMYDYYASIKIRKRNHLLLLRYCNPPKMHHFPLDVAMSVMPQV